jgi:protein-tyrosine-phosphatase
MITPYRATVAPKPAHVCLRARALLLSTLGLTALAGFGLGQEKSRAKAQPTVVFVCEHGAARSVIAAAYFNKLAVERQLPFRAIARGTTPQENPSASTLAGLQRDGIVIRPDKPKGLTASEASDALRVVSFCPLPPSIKASRVDTFDDVPPPADGYDRSRDAVLKHVRELLDELAGQHR